MADLGFDGKGWKLYFAANEEQKKKITIKIPSRPSPSHNLNETSKLNAVKREKFFLTIEINFLQLGRPTEIVIAHLE